MEKRKSEHLKALNRIEICEYDFMDGNNLHESNNKIEVFCEKTGQSYCVFNDVDFGEINSVTGFQAYVTAGLDAGWIELRIDSLDGPKIGICQVSQRAVDDGKGVVKTGIYGTEGIHVLYMIFIGNKDSRFSISWFKFTHDEYFNIKLVGETILPEQVPYLGPLENYFLGSGIACAGGSTDGVWDYLAGPSYSEGGYIDAEEIRIVVDGTEYPLNIEIRRARGTGVFCGTTCIGDLSINIIDYTNMGEPWVGRLIRIYNNSQDNVYNIKVRIYVKLASEYENSQKKCDSAKASIINNRALHIEHKPDYHQVIKSTDTSSASLNYYATIAFTDVSSKALEENSQYIIESEERNISPKEHYSTALYHYVHLEKEDSAFYLKAIQSRNAVSEVEKCIKEWQIWLLEGVSLERIPDQRTRDIIEGTTIIIKMQQGTDGGIMATPRTYLYSFMRDNHSALRGMIVAGHTKEAKMFLEWAHKKYFALKKARVFPIPNCAGINSNSYFLGFHNEDNWSAETPALYILIAKYYYQKTLDIETLLEIDESLCFAMEIQLGCAEKFGWRLYFSGDETDSFGSGILLKDSPLNGKTKFSIMEEWSMPSVMLCASSLEFFIDYLKIKGETLKAEDYNHKLGFIKDSLDKNFWREDLGIHDWYRGKKGEWPSLRLTNFTLMPLYYNAPLNTPERAVRDVIYIKQYINDRGFIAIQPEGLYDDFCGHTLGYLLYDLTVIDDPLKDRIYESLVYSGIVGCWGTWSEAYTEDGMSYGNREYGHAQTWDKRVHNMRPFESGTNLDAVLKYWGY